jgi:hypothetical protein
VKINTLRVLNATINNTSIILLSYKNFLEHGSYRRVYKGLKKNNNKKSNKFRAAIFVLEL